MSFLCAWGASAASESTNDTAATVDANLSGNIVTAVLILGVSIGVALILVLSKVIPMVRSGELSFKTIEFDWRAELLNATPKKEKARLAAEQAQRREMAAQRYQCNEGTPVREGSSDSVVLAHPREGDLDLHSTSVTINDVHVKDREAP